MILLVDGTIHGDEYVTPIDVLVDSGHHGKDYVKPIVVNANEIIFLPIKRFFVKVITQLHDFAETDWSAQQSLAESFA